MAHTRACILVRRWESRKHGVALWYGSLAVWLVIGGVLWYFAAYTGTRHPVMRVPALAYTLPVLTSGSPVRFRFEELFVGR